MEVLSPTEENYLKAIYKVSERDGKAANTNAIAIEMNTTAASVTDMLQRLSGKHLLFYEKYRGVTLTEEGSRLATHLIRKHRLWEVFLVDKLQFTWDEVHEMAEQLEHIQSRELVDRLDKYLGFPSFDPHGDPIPDANGQFAIREQVELAGLVAGDSGVIVGVQDHAPSFLQYLDKMELVLGAEIKVLEIIEYDESKKVLLNGQKEIVLSQKVCKNLFIIKSEK